MLLRICNGIAIELRQHILQLLIVVANLLHSSNRIATEIVMVSNETVADLLQICNGMATTLAYSLSFDFWDLATELATDVKSVAIEQWNNSVANPLVFYNRMPKCAKLQQGFLQHNTSVANLLLIEICNGFLWVCNGFATEKSVAKL